ncbi:flagellar hook assembly protein FlgD [bacterium]|nr:flagellar hook assembly protein FlgD [bacterium]
MSVDTQHALNQVQTSLRNRAATPVKSSDKLEKQDFMNLFLTQMSNQDPVSPMDSGAMMSQLAQLGTMEQLEKLNGQVKDLNLTQKDISRFQSLQFLEKDVLMESEGIKLGQGSAKPIYYSLDNEANNIGLTIEAEDGSPVFSQQLGLTTAGKHEYLWDGKNNEGVMMPDGNYKIRLLAFDTKGNSTPLEIFNSGRVAQVEYRNGQPWLKTKYDTMPISKVKTINTLSSRTFGNATPLPIIQNLPPKGSIVSGRDDELRKK